MNTTIDYAAARKRLASITTDPAALAGLDRISETGQLNDAFMRAVERVDQKDLVSVPWAHLVEGVEVQVLRTRGGMGHADEHKPQDGARTPLENPVR